MRTRLQEFAAAFVVLLCLVALPAWMFSYPIDRPLEDGRRVVALTGVKRAGVWTDQAVNASNHGFADFRPAVVRVDVGEDIVIRLTSADVTHGFYVPELGVGPVEVEPGHVTEVALHGREEGVFEYYCTQVCGECHYFMRGKVIVGNPPNADEPLPGLQNCPGHGESEHASAVETLAERGEQIFAIQGCSNCHGIEGVGGIENFNAIFAKVPALNGLGKRMMLRERADQEAILELLESGADLEAVEDPPFSRYSSFLAQYEGFRNRIHNGNTAVALDKTKPAPPLSMPRWGDVLDEGEITAILAYLITLQKWEK